MHIYPTTGCAHAVRLIMSNLRVLVVGASIAGPMAAYWLAKAGATVTVIERFPTLRAGGQNIDVRTCGVTVMRKVAGMEAAVRAKLAPLDGVRLVDAKGVSLVTLRGSGDAEQQSLISEFEIYRDELSRILHHLTANHARIRYVFGEQIASVQQQQPQRGSPVTVAFAHGCLPTADYDLIVAADGATSRTRTLALGGVVSDHLHSVNTWAAYFSIPAAAGLLPNDGGRLGAAVTRAPGRFMSLKPYHDATVHRAQLMGIHPRKADPDPMRAFREAQKLGDHALKTYVADFFADMGWVGDDILRAMMDASDFYASEIVQVKVPRLFSGRVVLVGDAGYAAGPTGAGTSLALTGAYVLAGEINDHAGDLQAGLEAYEERMRPIIRDMQRIPPGVPGLMAPQTQWGLQLRNYILMLVSALMAAKDSLPWLSKLLGWIGGLFASSFGKDKYNLPDYRWLSSRDE